MNFDFSALNFETIDSNINAYPDMFLNQNGVTFTKKVLEDLGYSCFFCSTAFGALCISSPTMRLTSTIYAV